MSPFQYAKHASYASQMLLINNQQKMSCRLNTWKQKGKSNLFNKICSVKHCLNHNYIKEKHVKKKVNNILQLIV